MNPTGGRADLVSFLLASWDAYRAAREGEEGIARRQRQRLGDIVAYARTHSLYYRQLYRLVPEPFSNISRLPAVTKAELMSQFDDWATDPAVTRASVDCNTTWNTVIFPAGSAAPSPTGTWQPRWPPGRTSCWHIVPQIWNIYATS